MVRVSQPFMDIACVTQCVGVILVDFSSFSIPKFLSERSALCGAVHPLCARKEENGLLCHHFSPKQNRGKSLFSFCSN